MGKKKNKKNQLNNQAAEFETIKDNSNVPANKEDVEQATPESSKESSQLTKVKPAAPVLTEKLARNRWHKRPRANKSSLKDPAISKPTHPLKIGEAAETAKNEANQKRVDENKLPHPRTSHSHELESNFPRVSYEKGCAVPVKPDRYQCQGNHPTDDSCEQNMGKHTKKTRYKQQKTKTVEAENDGEAQQSNQIGKEIEEHDCKTPTLTEFKFDGFHPILKCRKPECGRMTSCWDPKVVSCPRCGPKSYVRYCSKEHLYDDMQQHWFIDCGKQEILGPVDKFTIRPSQKPLRPYVNSPIQNNIERHRQAVYHSMEQEASYFVFNDRGNIKVEDDGNTVLKESIILARGTGEVMVSVVFADDDSPSSDKKVFENLLTSILEYGAILRGPDCMRAAYMIRDKLIETGDWSLEVVLVLRGQWMMEWGFVMPEILTHGTFMVPTLPPP